MVDQLWPGLAAELSGRRDAARTLAALARGQVFVGPHSVDQVCYEYPPIVRDVLRSQLRREAPNKVVNLHRLAAGWLAEFGRHGDAAIHAAAAGDWSDAASLVVDGMVVGQLIVGPEAGPLAEVFADMPADIPDPAAAVVRAASALGRADHEACAKELLRAAEFVDRGAPQDRPALRLCAAVVEAVCARAQDDLEAASRSAAAMESALAALAEPGPYRAARPAHPGLPPAGSDAARPR